jgi:dolichol-phosphate mannosyltransferase
MRKLVSIVSPCYNEEGNIEELYKRVCGVVDQIICYDFEFIFIDNASSDSTVTILKNIAKSDSRVKIIVNNRNFGHIRSPYWGVLQATGHATIYLASDLQDPPELITEFISKWESGFEVVLAAKPNSECNFLMHRLRRFYYSMLDKISDVPMTKDATGFGLYDKRVIDELKKINDPYPYFRGLVDELGFQKTTIEFVQPKRTNGSSSNNILSLYDYALLGIVNHSIVPIRIISIFGIFLGVSTFAAMNAYIFYSLYYHGSVELVMLVLLFLFFVVSLLIIFIGFLGEYILAVLRYVRKRPILVERERVNF